MKMNSLSRAILYGACSEISDDPANMIKELADKDLETGFLEPKEYVVLQHRLPFPECDYKTLERIGKEDFLKARSRERVRQIEARATRKIMGTIKMLEPAKKITFDTPISELLELPEINWKTRRRDGKAARVEYFLIETCRRMGFETLEDLKIYIEENGWGPKYYKTTWFKNIGVVSVEYFNNILKKYGIEPLGPMYIK